MADEEDQVENEELAEGADEDGAEGGEDEEEGGGSKKLILLIVVPIVLLLAVGAGLYFTGMLDGVLGKAEECVQVEDEHGEMVEQCPEEEAHGEKGGDHGAAAGGGDHGEEAKGGGDHGEGGHGGASAFLALPTMIVNLRTEDETPRYLRLTVQLEMNSAADVPAVEAVIPRVVDQFQTYLRELRVKDLRGSAGIYRLQMELLWRVNQAAAPVEVKDVLFQEILIQ